MRVDAHAHMLPADYRRELERRDLLRFPLPPWSEEALDALMARHAIDAAVLSLSPPGVWFGDQGLADDLARRVNELIAAKVEREPRRFGGLAVLPLPDIDRSLAELTNAYDTLDLDGVILSSNTAGVYLGDPSLDPLMAELDRRGAYVLRHPTVPPNPLPLPQHPMWLYEFPFDTTRAVVNMIYTGTLTRFPNIRWQISHLGGAATFLAQRIASLADREPEKAADAGAGAIELLGRLWYDTGLSNNRIALASTREVAPDERIVFGTDWPYAALPPDGDPAPELDVLGAGRAAVDATNVAALVPRLAGR